MNLYRCTTRHGKLAEYVNMRNVALRKSKPFKVGDKVFRNRRTAGIDRAFLWLYRRELYTVTDVMSTQHVRIECPTTSTRMREQDVHVHRFKHHAPRAEALDFTDLLPLNDKLEAPLPPATS